MHRYWRSIICLLLAVLCMSSMATAAAVAKRAAVAQQTAEITVMAAESNKPVAGARLELSEDKNRQAVIAVRTSGEDGKITLQLAAGNYRYLVKAAGYGIATGYLYVDAKEKASASSWLNKAASLSGRLVDGTGQPVANARLTIDRLQQTVTDAQGGFRFGDLDIHGHDLQLEHPGWTFEKPTYPQLNAGEQKELGDLVIRRAAQLELTVQLSNTCRLTSPAGITVTLSGNGVWRSAKVANDGRLQVANLPPGDYLLATSDSRLQRSELQLSLKEGERQTLSLTATPRPPMLEIEEYGDIFLPDKPLKLRVNGLWVTTATVTVSRVDNRLIVNGSAQPGPNPTVAQTTLTPVKRLAVTLKPSRSEARSRGSFILPPLPPGAYLLQVTGNEATTALLFLVTRLGVIAKVAPDSTLLLATDLLTGKSLAGVRVQGRSVGSQAIVTAPDGTANWNRSTQGSTLAAQWGDNLALLSLSSEEVPQQSSDIKGYLYTERTAYRPGQTVYFKGVLRRIAGDDYQLPPQQPVQIKITDPGDKTVHEATLPLNSRGSFHGSFELPAKPALGEYQLSAGNDSQRWQGSFKVLEYRKPEFEVKLKPQGQYHLSGSQVPVRVSGRYYFGAPVAGAKLTWRAYSLPFEPDEEDQQGGGFGEESHTFGGYGEFIAEGEAQLDANGEALLAIPAKQHDLPTGYNLEVDLTDSGSRQVSAETRFTVVPALVNLRISGEQYLLKPGQQTSYLIRVSDWQGNAKAGVGVTMTVNEQRYDKKGKRFTWHEAAQLQGQTGRDGSVRLGYRFPRSGYWQLSAMAKDEQGRISRRETGAWVWNAGSSWDDNYRELQAEFDKKSYKPGESARLIVRTPAIGATLLLTLEGRRIHQRRLIPLTSAVQVVEIPVGVELAPNIHVSAVVVHGGRFYQQTGLLKVDFEPGKLTLQVTPERPVYAPGDTARIKIESSADGKPAPAELSLAVVDQAIFAVAPETRDDIYRFFRGRREHLVTTIHSFPRLYLGGASKDAALKAAEDDLKGIKVRKIFKDTAGWFPVLETAPDGSATAEITLPDNLTTWRATAVGHSSDQRFGSAQATFIARLPFMTRLNPPRFFVEGDQLQIPGLVTDATGQEQQVQGRFEAQGLTLLGESAFSATLPANGTVRRDIALKAGASGQATLRLLAKGSQGADALELTLPILQRGLGREAAAGIALRETAAETVLTLPDDHQPGSGSVNVTFSPTVADSLMPALERLIAYPYGCVEQTLARFMPAAYARMMLAQGQRGLSPDLERRLPAILNEGVKRLQEFQHSDGGWGWWKNDQTKPELTAMVMYGFAVAAKAGLEIDQGVHNRGMKALEQQLANAKPLQAALLYRALTANQANAHTALETRMAKEIDKLPVEGKLAWAEALLNLGRKREAAALLDRVKAGLKQEAGAAYLPEEDGRWRFGGSSLETTAALLSTLQRSRPDDPLAPKLAEYLSRKQAGGWWRSTSYSSAAVMALADFVASSGELTASYTAELTHNGRSVASYTVEQGRLTSGPATLNLTPVAGANRFKLTRDRNSGSAYLSASMFWRVPPEAASSAPGLNITRSIYRIKSVKDGERWRHEYTPLKPGEPVSVGEELELRLVVESDRSQEYVILEDHLPAGFELRQADKDPRYANEAWYHGWYDHKERRDALVAWFIGWLPAGRHEFRSVIYPELAGSVLALPASVWPMYRPELRSESSPWQVEIRP